MADDIPEQVYFDAAMAAFLSWGYGETLTKDEIAKAATHWASTAGIRAAVQSAYRAGQASYCHSPICSVNPVPHLRAPGCPGQVDGLAEGGARVKPCDLCGQATCSICGVCLSCAGDGHCEGCPREGDEYTEEQRRAIEALNIGGTP